MMDPGLERQVNAQLAAELARSGGYTAMLDQLRSAGFTVLAPGQPTLPEVRRLIHDLAGHEKQACSYDHHGYCQEHGWLDEGECPVPRAHAFLAATGGPL